MSEEFDKAIKDLLKFLNTERPKMAPYSQVDTKRYCKIVAGGDSSAHCFVVKKNFSNKTVGVVKKGDILAAASWSRPANHPRGQLFDRSSWDKTFEGYGVRYLR